MGSSTIWTVGTGIPWAEQELPPENEETRPDDADQATSMPMEQAAHIIPSYEYDVYESELLHSPYWMPGNDR